MKKRQLRNRVRELRRQGLSISEIVRLTNTSLHTVKHWVRDIVISEEVLQNSPHGKRYRAQIAAAHVSRVKHRELRRHYQEEGRIKAREGNPLHLKGCMLYWAEGGKYRNQIMFANSDPNMMLLFIHFLREELTVGDNDMIVNIHAHTTNFDEIQRIEAYWLNLLSLPVSCLGKTSHKKGSKSRNNRLEYGICRLEIHNTQLIQHIYGAIQEYVGFENPDWLG
ncbi:MAG: hypothetical protein D6737_13530 [Chloroflexi bacterium]|nr:MAG: hypothetical protein CUN54_03275 [Phototrophicales bacterium]RMF78798.1 MAG: hypothetical protein D6737_13530 [Chloroflexota bacterium]